MTTHAVLERAMIAWAVVMVAARTSTAGSPFATAVIDYAPAPGQFVTNSLLNDPNVTLGPPDAAGLSLPATPSIVTLGGFGGFITLAFDHTVEDDPLNPFGMDAIVFGNAFYLGHVDTRFAEAATIEISLDVNGNSLADDEWYLIPGSHIPDPSGQRAIVTWDDNINDSTYLPDFDFWIPSGRSGVWTTQGFLLPSSVFAPPTSGRVVVNPLAGQGVEGIFGYADFTPTLAFSATGSGQTTSLAMTVDQFYTTPDDPLVVGITPGSGGGDAFDIAWAVDPNTGEPARIAGFDFIRLTTAVHRVPGPADMDFPLGEVSSEIDAVSDVAPDPFGDFDSDDDIDLADLAGLQNCFGHQAVAEPSCNRLDREPNQTIDLIDYVSMVDRLTGPR